jgi:hypothetical protein
VSAFNAIERSEFMEKPWNGQNEQALVVQNDLVRRVYGWMSAGLGLTALVALFVVSSPELMKMIFGNRLVFFGLVFGELGLVVALSAAINRMSGAAATLMFLLYAALNGATMAAIFLMYTGSSIASTFFVTAGTFGAMSIYGYATKRDLTSWGSFLFMGLIGIIIASLVNIFLQSPAVAWVVSCCGVLVFVGLTAYDTQKIKALSWQRFDDRDGESRVAVLGALTLYLDFINLFLMMLRLFGTRRD